MSDATKAVFLSYASQDAEAAKKICDALRAVGVEVWFDQSELVGGDAWDQKIRKQIKDCALLIPIISAATQARTEGYFRLEWRLADQRTHLMAKGRPFLLPVVIDDTRDADAHVPDSFTEVQWTRLPDGETPPAFAERVKKLLAGEVAPVSDRRSAPEETIGAGHRPARPRKSKPVWPWLVLPVVMIGVTLAVWEPWKRIVPNPPQAALPAAPAHSEARELVAKARALVLNDQWDEATREDFALAEQLLGRAVELDPTDGEAWAADALCSCGQIAFRYDSSQARKEVARHQAERAMKLAPDSNQALFALAFSYRYQQSTTATESLRMFRQLVEREPTNKFMLRELARVLEDSGSAANREEALTYYDRAVALPGSDPTALRLRADHLFDAGHYVAAEAAINQALALRPAAGHLYVSKLEYLLYLRRDLAEARALLAKMPATYLLDDLGAYAASWVWLWSREPDNCLAVLGGLPHDYLDCRYFIGPKAWLTGAAHQLAGRPEAAMADWRIALQKVEQRLAAEPGATLWLRWRAQLLAVLGERGPAESALRVYEQLLRIPPSQLTPDTWRIYLILGRSSEVIDYLTTQLKTNRDAQLIGILRHDPGLDPLRDDPRFQQLLRDVEATVAPPPALDLKTLPETKSVAVLAFANLSDDKDNEYFSDGISEELLTVLQKIPGLHVAARTSAFSFKGKNATAQEIGATLRVATLVEGSVRKAGNSVRITARLSRANDGEQLWSESYTRELKDVFAVQSEIAQTIVGQLRGQLGGADGSAAKAEIQAQVQAAEKGGTKNVEAHQLYLQGKYFLNQYSLDNINRAIGLLQRAVDLDPKFTLAWAGLSQAGSLKGGYGMTKQELDDGNALARRAADRALALEPDLPATLLAQATAQVNEFNWKAALVSSRHVVTLAPDDSEVISFAGVMAYTVGDTVNAVELHKHAVALDPVNPRLRAGYAAALTAVHRFDEAEAESRRIIELSPDGPWGYSGVSLTYSAEGRFDDALKEGEKESVEWSRLLALAIAQWGLGKKTESDATLAHLIKDYADVSAYQIAEVYAFRHDNDRAFEWLERALRQRDGGLAWTRPDWWLEGLHPDPRWPVFLRKVGLADDPLK